MSYNESLLKEKPQQASQIESLFQLDIKTDTLKQFLENLLQVVNNQSQQISQLSIDIKQKTDNTKIETCFNSIQESIQLFDNELYKTVSHLIEKQKPENTGDALTDKSNKICNKMILLGHSIQYLNKTNCDWDKKLQMLTNEVNKKCSSDDLKNKVKKAKTKLMFEIDELRKKVQKQIDDYNRKLTNQLSGVEVNLKETEKKTLWKIQDCESLLQKRVTVEFVDNSCKQLEDKLLKEIAKQREENFGSIFKNIDEIKEKQKLQDEVMNEKIKNLKKQIKDTEDGLVNKLCPIERHDQFKKASADKFGELETKITNLEKRGDANLLFGQMKDIFKEQDEKMANLDKDNQNLQVRINELQVKVQKGMVFETKEGGDKQENFVNDPHKLCQLEADLKRLKGELQETNNQFKSLDAELKRKFETLEHKVLGNFALLKKQDDQTLQKDEVITMIERARILLEEKIKSSTKDFDELKSKISQLQDMDRRAKKKTTSGIEDGELMQRLNQKVDANDMRKEFLLYDEKFRNMNDLIAQFRREFETIQEFYNQLSIMLKTNQQETISVITGNSRIITNRCLACGTKGKQQLNSQELKGSDGKFYKADYGSQKYTNIYENQEIFDVTPQQIIQNDMSEDQRYEIQQQQLQQQQQFQQKTSSSASSKQQVLSFKDKQSTGKIDDMKNSKLPAIQEKNEQKQSSISQQKQ